MSLFSERVGKNAMNRHPPVLKRSFDVKKSDDEKQYVFGWASVAVTADGEQIEDHQEDIIDIEDLEQAAYHFVKFYREGGEMHERGGCAVLIESCVFTKEKVALMEVPDGTLPEAWWIGFHVTDKDVWEKVKSGEYSMFSIEGKATRMEVQDEH